MKKRALGSQAPRDRTRLHLCKCIRSVHIRGTRDIDLPCRITRRTHTTPFTLRLPASGALRASLRFSGRLARFSPKKHGVRSIKAAGISARISAAGVCEPPRVHNVPHMFAGVYNALRHRGPRSTPARSPLTSSETFTANSHSVSVLHDAIFFTPFLRPDSLSTMFSAWKHRFSRKLSICN